MKKLRILPKKRIQFQLDFVSSRTMKKLNSDFRGINSSTDILSFEQPMISSIKGLCILGDLVICTTVMQKQAKKNKIKLEHEFSILLVHGILHLLGFDHENAKQEQKMHKLEKQVLARLKIAAGLILRSKLNSKPL